MQEHSGWSAQPTFSLGASLIFPACAQLSLLLSCIIACLILWWFWCSSSYSHEVFRLSICPPQVAKQLSKRLSWKSLGTHMLLNHTHNVSTTSKCWWGKWQEFLAGEDNTVRFIDSLMGLKLHNYTNLSCDSFSLEKGFTPSEGPECIQYIVEKVQSVIPSVHISDIPLLNSQVWGSLSLTHLHPIELLQGYKLF